MARFECISFSYVTEQRKSPEERVIYEFLMGKILDVFPDYCKEAEEHLSKAVKLNPSLVDAWLCLGNCIWKKGNLASARNCFLLALSKSIISFGRAQIRKYYVNSQCLKGVWLNVRMSSITQPMVFQSPKFYCKLCHRPNSTDE
uniref:Tetratricopeptide repeat protein 5 n=1 Tax=Aegilops tauschii TaxID=37682 RepID=N1QXB2_AEGTA